MRIQICVTAAVLSAVWGLARPAMATPLLDGVNVVNQARVNLTRESRHGQVIVFLSTKCPCSLSHEPALDELAKSFPEFKFTAIHSNQNESLDDSTNHFKRANLSFPVVRDEGAKLADTFGAYKTPHAYVLDAEGNKFYEGGVDDSKLAARAERHYLKEALLALRENRKPEFSQQRTLGCEIQR